MEALTAASVAALTVYDMVKAVDKSAVIESVRLLTKSGGKSGAYEAPAAEPEAPPAKPARPTKAAPRVLMSETGGPKAGTPTQDREALRSFMVARHLRASEWAKSEAVPVNELYGYLSGRSRVLPPETAEKLAKAARASIDQLFGRKGAR